jgi:hypothetical protein
VALYNLSSYIKARRAAKALLAEHPDFRLAAAAAGRGAAARS